MDRSMLIERDLQVMNFDAVGDAYAIAANYLRRSGILSGDGVETDDRLLEIVVGLYCAGEHNRLKLANKAIARFQVDS
jgi:hypothetical protein